MTDNVFKFLWKYVSKLKLLALVVLLSVIFGEIAARYGLFYASKIIEVLSLDLPKNEIFYEAVKYAIWVAVFFLLKGILLNVVIFFEALFLPKYNALIAKDLFAFAHKHSTAFFDEEKAGNVSAKIKTIIDA